MLLKIKLPCNWCGEIQPEQIGFQILSIRTDYEEIYDTQGLVTWCYKKVTPTFLVVSIRLRTRIMCHCDLIFEYWLKPGALTAPPAPVDPDAHGDLYCLKGFRTGTQRQWSLWPEGCNLGTFLEQNFHLCFPDGVLVGSEMGHYLKFNSAETVRKYLQKSRGGLPGKLLQTQIDPVDPNHGGNLTSQVLALCLNLGFDECETHPAFSKADLPLRDLIVVDESSPCYRLTVNDIFELANDVLGGVNQSITPAEIMDCVAKINENFKNSGNQGFLGL